VIAIAGMSYEAALGWVGIGLALGVCLALVGRWRP
jgi:hypothetical protein